MSPLRWIGLLALLLLMVLVVRHGAWRELMTLESLVDPASETRRGELVRHLRATIEHQ